MPLDCNTSQDNTSVVAWKCYAVDDAFAAAAEEDAVVAVVAKDVGESPLERVAGCAMMMRPIQ
jgi:hypothetical protein